MIAAQRQIDTLIKVGAENLLEGTIRKLVQIQIARYQAAINRLKPDLEKFEKRFDMSSEDCYQRFNAGELGDDGDIFEWVSLYESTLLYRKRIQMLGTALS